LETTRKHITGGKSIRSHLQCQTRERFLLHYAAWCHLLAPLEDPWDRTVSAGLRHASATSLPRKTHTRAPNHSSFVSVVDSNSFLWPKPSNDGGTAGVPPLESARVKVRFTASFLSASSSDFDSSPTPTASRQRLPCHQSDVRHLPPRRLGSRSLLRKVALRTKVVTHTYQTQSAPPQSNAYATYDYQCCERVDVDDTIMAGRQDMDTYLNGNADVTGQCQELLLGSVPLPPELALSRRKSTHSNEKWHFPPRKSAHYPSWSFVRAPSPGQFRHPCRICPGPGSRTIQTSMSSLSGLRF
jgi:hypothetical protein